MKNIDKMDYDSVYQVFDTLHFVFGAGDGEEIDDRCQALWVLFLSSVGWTQEEFWAEWDQEHENTCSDCGGKIIDEVVDKKKQN
jgi:hypothetical protein